MKDGRAAGGGRGRGRGQGVQLPFSPPQQLPQRDARRLEAEWHDLLNQFEARRYGEIWGDRTSTSSRRPPRSASIRRPPFFFTALYTSQAPAAQFVDFQTVVDGDAQPRAGRRAATGVSSRRCGCEQATRSHGRARGARRAPRAIRPRERRPHLRRLRRRQWGRRGGRRSGGGAAS